MGDWRKEYLLYSKLGVFRRNIEKAQRIIDQALSMTDVTWAASSSFGKDSIVMLDLITQVAPRIPVLHMDSGYCLPELYEIREWWQRERNIDLRVRKSSIDYIDLIREFGLPDINRTKAQQAKVVQIIKKDNATTWCHENGITGQFLGLRKEESNGRRISLLKRSPIYQMQDGMWKCCPLADWTAKDVWAYIVTRNLPYPKFYDYDKFGQNREWIRSSSWITTDGAAEKGRLGWLKYYYPEYYEKLADLFPQVRF